MTYLTADQIQIQLIHSSFYHSHIRKEEYFNRTGTGRIIEHYELDVFSQGEARLTLDGVPYCYEPGSVCLRKPGQCNQQDYNYHYTCYAIIFSVYKTDTGELIDGSKDYSCFLDYIPDYCEPKNYSAILQAVASMHHVKQSLSELEKLRQNIGIAQILYELYPLSEKKQSKTDSVHPAVKKAIAYFSMNLDTDISMKEVADYVGLSEKYFQRIFKASTGKTPNAFCMQLRMDIAAKKLLITKKTVAEIAYESGFSSCSYFNYSFKKQYHQTPIEYRNGSK